MVKRITLLYACFCFGVLLLVLSFSIIFYRKSYLSEYVIALTCLLAGLFIVSLAYKSKLSSIIRSVVLVVCITYVLTELATYILLSFGIVRSDIGFFYNGIMATDKKFAVYDSISGFRGVPGKFRYLSIEGGKLEMDHYIDVNNQGWFSRREYSYTKASPHVKRYIVLGDSYSAALATAVPWSDLVQDKLANSGCDSIELYNFSLDGTGIANWHSLFFKEVVPKYDFDGVIIASSSEKSAHPDLDRHFFTFHSYEDNTAMQMINLLKDPIPKTFPKERGVSIIPIYHTQELNWIKEKYLAKTKGFHFELKKPDLWFLSAFYGITDGLKNMIHLTNNASAYQKPYETYYAMVDQPYKMEYFDQRYKYGYLLKEIINHCKANKKEVILTCIPDVENAKEYGKGKNVMCLNELKYLSEYYNVKLFNGFQLFAGKSEGYIDSVYYEYDRHWNKEGARLFADAFFKSKVLNN